MRDDRPLVLGAGVTGLAAARAGGLVAVDAASRPGGLCRSYYVRAQGTERLAVRPADGRAWRFEVGGGHWIFGGDALLLDWLDRLAPLLRYERRAAVFFSRTGLLVPYPLQNHLATLGKEVALAALCEMTRPVPPVETLAEWLRANFGSTLFELFFSAPSTSATRPASSIALHRKTPTSRHAISHSHSKAPSAPQRQSVTMFTLLTRVTGSMRSWIGSLAISTPLANRKS